MRKKFKKYNDLTAEDIKEIESLLNIGVRVKDIEKANKLGDVLRALPGVLTVTNAGANAEAKSSTFKVKIISQKSPEEAYNAFKSNAESKYSFINQVEIGIETIEEK